NAYLSYVEVRRKAVLLHLLEVPPPDAGGNTYFANMFAAYEALPADLKEAAKDKIAVHDASTNSAGMLRKGYKAVTDVRKTVGARHPLIRTEPTTGRKALFLGRRPNAYVLGLEVSESLETAWQDVDSSFERFCLTAGIGAIEQMLCEDAQQLAGAPHNRSGGRVGHRWGKTKGKIGFHGGKVAVHRPR